MVKPFISYALHRKSRAEWLDRVLVALGFEEAALACGADPKLNSKDVKRELEKAQCLFALVSAAELGSGSSATGQPRGIAGQGAIRQRGKQSGSTRAPGREERDPTRPAPWIAQAMHAAILQEIPLTILSEPGVDVSEWMDFAIRIEGVDFDSPGGFEDATPDIIAEALNIKRILGKDPSADCDYVLDSFHVLNRFPNEREWEQVRNITLSARKRVESVNHNVEIPMDLAGGFSVKIADDERDLTKNSALRIMCESHAIHPELVLNDDRVVEYKITFTPPLVSGKSVTYRHESHHSNVFPMTYKGVRDRSQQKGSLPFATDGLVGEGWSFSRPVTELVLEIEASLDLGLSDPEVRAYYQSSSTEREEETGRIGNPRSRPRLWKESEDKLRRQWKCQVTIPDPRPEITYYLLVRPTK